MSARAAWIGAALALASCDAPSPATWSPSYRPLIAHNAKAAVTSGVPALLERTQATGRGVLIAQWDEGAVRASHADMTGRVMRRDEAPLSEHATHIAGTLIGAGELDAAARGMAAGAHLWSYRWDWDVLEERAAAPFIAVSAHAYGVALGWAPAGEGCANGATFFGGTEHEDPAFGAYGKSAAELDRMLYEMDAVSVWAAGNERMDAGPSGDAPHYHYPDCATEQHDVHADEATLIYGTLGGPLSAKNAIAVGAVADVAVSDIAPELIVPLSFSSFGPTDDGRIKPDIAASGETLYSTSAEADDAYGVFGGTSSAAAVVAGGIALLTEHYRTGSDRDPNAAEIKALLVQTAREAGPHPGPDYALGYGLFDAGAAAGALNTIDQRRIGSLEDGETLELRTERIAAGTPLRVTLAWLDPAAAIDGTSPAALVNDLDIALIAPDRKTEHYPWRLDPLAPASAARRDGPNEVDTVERIDVSASENVWDGIWSVRIRASRGLHRGLRQRFAVTANVAIDAPPSPAPSTTRRVLVQLAEGESTAEVPLTFADLNQQPLAWSLASDVSWLELSATEGATSSSSVLRVDASELAAGQAHLATIQLRAGDERREIGVVVERACNEACSLPPAACSTVSLGSALGDAVAHGRTEPATGVQPGGCGDSNGASTTFSWRAPHADTFDITLTGASTGALLYALDAPCQGEELACASSGEGQRVSLALEAGQSAAIVVDSPPEASFVLAIHSARGVCYGQCGGSPDQGGCYCDAACVERGDCCPGACEACGQCDAARCEPEGCAGGERCVRGRCEPDACLTLEDGDPCDDGDACTEHDVCIGGACAGAAFACDRVEDEPDASAVRDAGPPPLIGEDAGVDAGEDAAANDMPSRDATACSCRVIGNSRTPPLAPSLACLLALALRRWTRRMRSP